MIYMHLLMHPSFTARRRRTAVSGSCPARSTGVLTTGGGPANGVCRRGLIHVLACDPASSVARAPVLTAAILKKQKVRHLFGPWHGHSMHIHPDGNRQ